MMLELILEVAIKGAEVLPALVKDLEGTITKIEADPALASKVTDALKGLVAVLDDGYFQNQAYVDKVRAAYDRLRA